MLVAYLTTDAVNEDLALQMADECGVTLYPYTFNGALPNGRLDAILFDWDSLPLQRRQTILFESLADPSFLPVAVHGCGLEEEEIETFHQDGVAVFHRLEPELFKTLRHLSRGKARVDKHELARSPAVTTDKQQLGRQCMTVSLET
jgi:hypothetical protein